MGRWRLDDAGQAAVMVIIIALGFLVLLGLVSDGGMVLAQRRDLQGLADGAARAGAEEVDQAVLRNSGVTQIDPAAAQARVAAYLQAAGFTGTSQVTPGANDVSVQLTETDPVMFAKFLGMSSVTLHAVGDSSPIGSGLN